MRGSHEAHNIGNTLQLRTRTIEYGLSPALKVYEVLYNNWNPVGDLRQNKIGRFIVSETLDGTHNYFNDYDAFVPVLDLTESEIPMSFSVFGERIAVKQHLDDTLTYG